MIAILSTESTCMVPKSEADLSSSNLLSSLFHDVQAVAHAFKAGPGRTARFSKLMMSKARRRLTPTMEMEAEPEVSPHPAPLPP